MKIYDAFLFFNELDLLEIRLELLYNHVDYFIISECDTTFSGIKKPFYYEENKDKFKKYCNKIIHVKHTNCIDHNVIKNDYLDKKRDILDDIISYYRTVQFSEKTANGQAHWCREILQREYVKIGMDNCKDDDIIIFSDLDEIPDPKKIITDGRSYYMNQKNMIYYINKENITEKWYGTVVMKFENLKNKALNQIRSERASYIPVMDGGWHLSFMGGESRISEKIKSYGHQEYNNNYIHSQISNKLNNNQDVLGRQLRINSINIEDYYPSSIVSMIREKFNYLINE